MTTLRPRASGPGGGAAGLRVISGGAPALRRVRAAAKPPYSRLRVRYFVPNSLLRATLRRADKRGAFFAGRAHDAKPILRAGETRTNTDEHGRLAQDIGHSQSCAGVRAGPCMSVYVRVCFARTLCSAPCAPPTRGSAPYAPPTRRPSAPRRFAKNGKVCYSICCIIGQPSKNRGKNEQSRHRR